jgi:hypothetical protein
MDNLDARRRAFLPWLLQQTNRDDRVGDLARDAAAQAIDNDDGFSTGYETLRDEVRRGCCGARRSLVRALHEFRRYRMQRSQ